MASPYFNAYEANLSQFFKGDLIDHQLMLSVVRRPLMSWQTERFDTAVAWQQARALDPVIKLPARTVASPQASR